MNIYKTPLKGCKVYATEQHPYKQPDQLVGTVHFIEGAIVTFKDEQGNTDQLIWKFKDGQVNKFFKFGA